MLFRSTNIGYISYYSKQNKDGIYDKLLSIYKTELQIIDDISREPGDFIHVEPSCYRNGIPEYKYEEIDYGVNEDDSDSFTKDDKNGWQYNKIVFKSL